MEILKLRNLSKIIHKLVTGPITNLVDIGRKLVDRNSQLPMTFSGMPITNLVDIGRKLVDGNVSFLPVMAQLVFFHIVM